jgi:putative transposase
MSKTFIHELPLKTEPKMEKEINICLDMGGMLYNVVLKETLKRLSLMKQSKLWQKACKAKKNRTELFRKALKIHGFSDYSLQKFTILTKNKCCIGKHLDTHVCQKISTRAYLAVDKYLKKIRGKPRFKRRGWISSLEGKDNKAGIRFKDGKVYWRGLKIPVILDKKDPYLIESNALNSKVKFCRIIRKNIKGKHRYFVQLILEGKPLIKDKNISKNEVVGLDIGPSTIAFFSSEKAGLKAFCEELEPFSKNIGSIQRKMDRSRKILNPQNYEKDGRIKKGKLTWVKSNRYKKKQKTLSGFFRKLKEYRKRLHGKLANNICKLGNHIKTEKIFYKEWQKTFGKSIGRRSPATFLNILRRKVENTGGQLEEFSTKTTCLSQVCHKCKTKKKKKLSQRWHECCGFRSQRDLYTAFLSYHVKNNVLDINQAKLAWPSAQSLLEQAISRLNQVANGKSRLASFGLSQRQSSSLVKDRSEIN